jgi:hypothetical protein
MTKLICFLFLAVQFNQLSAQDLTLSVKKGKAVINGKDMLTNYPPKKIQKTDKISATDNSILVIRKGSSITKINCPCTNLSFALLNKKLSSSKAKVSYADVIFNKPLETEAKPQGGSVSRGEGGVLDTFSINIMDTAWVMNDFYRVKWNSDLPSKQLGSIRLYSKLSTEPILESSEKHIDLKALNPGWYHLDFEIEQKANTESWNLEASYVFYIPTKEEKEQVLIEYQGITEELKQFEDDELSEIILDAYVTDRRLYGLGE